LAGRVGLRLRARSITSRSSASLLVRCSFVQVSHKLCIAWILPLHFLRRLPVIVGGLDSLFPPPSKVGLPFSRFLTERAHSAWLLPRLLAGKAFLSKLVRKLRLIDERGTERETVRYRQSVWISASWRARFSIFSLSAFWVVVCSTGSSIWTCCNPLL